MERPNGPTISVAMTTYNGSSYIREQLESIRLQTRAADEVIIVDDCSTDLTPDIIKAYIAENHLDDWHLITNEKNLGWRSNFFKAIGETHGDIVFCSDQDDVWERRKIELMSSELILNEDALCLACQRTVIGANGEQNSLLSIEAESGTVAITGRLEEFNTTKLLGCCCAYKRKLVEMYLNVCDRDYGHDVQLCRLAALYAGAYVSPDVLVHYRIHGSNASGVTGGIPLGSSTLKKRIEEIDDNISWLEMCLNVLPDLDSRQVDIALETLEFQRLRSAALRKGWLAALSVLPLLGKYKKLASLQLMMGDLAYAAGINVVGGRMLWEIRAHHHGKRAARKL